MAYDAWKVNPADRFKGNILKAVAFDGTVTNIGKLPEIASVKVTRHHVIDIKTLQDVWNQACDREDDQVIDALCDWAGCPSRQQTVFIANKLARPNKLIQAICWNPFNIVVGAGSTVREDNPGDHEFDYIAFVDMAHLSIARQEFNIHVKRLRRIEQYMNLYCNLETPLQIGGTLRPFAGPTHVSLQQHMNARDLAVNGVTIRSLVELLKSDMPIYYPALFAALRSQIAADDAGINQVNDNQRPDHASAFSASYLPGCLIDPQLWSADGLSSTAMAAGLAGI